MDAGYKEPAKELWLHRSKLAGGLNKSGGDGGNGDECVT
jgi:hypothetical protein